MKKIILLSVVILIATSVFSQDKKPRLKKSDLTSEQWENIMKFKDSNGVERYSAFILIWDIFPFEIEIQKDSVTTLWKGASQSYSISKKQLIKLLGEPDEVTNNTLVYSLSGEKKFCSVNFVLNKRGKVIVNYFFSQCEGFESKE